MKKSSWRRTLPSQISHTANRVWAQMQTRDRADLFKCLFNDKNSGSQVRAKNNPLAVQTSETRNRTNPNKHKQCSLQRFINVFWTHRPMMCKSCKALVTASFDSSGPFNRCCHSTGQDGPRTYFAFVVTDKKNGLKCEVGQGWFLESSKSRNGSEEERQNISRFPREQTCCVLTHLFSTSCRCFPHWDWNTCFIRFVIKSMCSTAQQDGPTGSRIPMNSRCFGPVSNPKHPGAARWKTTNNPLLNLRHLCFQNGIMSFHVNNFPSTVSCHGLRTGVKSELQIPLNQIRRKANSLKLTWSVRSRRCWIIATMKSHCSGIRREGFSHFGTRKAEVII